MTSDNLSSGIAATSLALATLGLTLLGGGVLPGTAAPAAGLLALVWLCLTLRGLAAADISGARPASATMPIVWIGLAGLGFLIITAIPVDGRLSVWHGALRIRQHQAVIEQLTRMADLGLIERPAGRFALSRNLGGTLRMIILVALTLSAGVLAAWMSSRDRRRSLRGLMLLGAAIGLAGYVAQYHRSPGDTLWWIIPVPPSLPGPVACFVNRNHYGGFLALIAVPGFILTVDDLRSRRFGWAAGMGLATGVMVAALVAGQSRGALLAWVAGMLVACRSRAPGDIASSSRPVVGSRRIRAVALPLAGAALLAAAVILAPSAVRQRLHDTLRQPLRAASVRSRIEAWQETVLVWQRYPWIGAGANGLRTVYPQHRISTHREARTHAENQYLQILAETGLVGMALFLALATLLARALRQPDGNADPPSVLRRVAWAALTVAAVHAVVDFPHHVPLYSAVMAGLIGVGLPRPFRGRGWREIAWPAACLAAVLLVMPAGRAIATRDDPVALTQASLPDLSQALIWTPTAWQAWYELGRRTWTATGDARGVELGLNALRQAADLDPNNYRVWYELGHAYLRVGDRAGARAAFARVRELRDWVKLPVIEPEPNAESQP